MNITTGPRMVRIVLSERNLKTLLYKLTQPDSHKTLLKQHIDGVYYYVTVQEDLPHYAGREPGEMSEDTEQHLAGKPSGFHLDEAEREEGPFSRAVREEADRAILRRAESEQKEHNAILFKDGKGKLS